MPFSHHSGGIALRTKQGGEGGAVGLDHGVALDPVQYPILEAIAPGVASGKQTVAGGRATGGRCMGIGEAHSHAGQSVHLRGVELGIVGIAGEVLISRGVPHPHVVRHHKYDVGAFGGEKSAEAKGSGK